MTPRTAGLRVGVVAKEPVALGFRLAGLPSWVAASTDEAGARLSAMSRDGGWGVVLVQGELLSSWAPVGRDGSETGLPLVVPFPGPTRESPEDEARAYVAELLRRAVGYRVRLR